MTTTAESEHTLSSCPTRILSLEDLCMEIPDEIRRHIQSQYQYEDCENVHNHNDTTNGLMMEQSMKRPPAITTCRVNWIQASTREAVMDELCSALKQQRQQQPSLDSKNWDVQAHAWLSDVICVRAARERESSYNYHLKGPTPSFKEEVAVSEFPSFPNRARCGWPNSHRVVIVDRFCGEAVLRGSHIFVKGILCTDRGIQRGHKVAVYADVPSSNNDNKNFHHNQKLPPRGSYLEAYRGRQCVYLGLGIARYARADFFRLEQGVGIQMVLSPQERVGPLLPSLSSLSSSKLFFQNLPSMAIAHALDLERGQTILDMCAAPGGKTSHVASLLHNQATIVACDSSRRKIMATKSMFRSMGASCITALAMNTQKCLASTRNSGDWKSVQEVLQSSSEGPDGILNVECFYPESFDRILLDPPCSALGLRPRLQFGWRTMKELQHFPRGQQRFIQQAVQLLKPGGVMTYSTCTVLADENERIVRYLLDEFGSQMELLPVLPLDSNMGREGLQGMGLNETERKSVLRFEPVIGDPDRDTIGFFVAKFRKKMIP